MNNTSEYTQETSIHSLPSTLPLGQAWNKTTEENFRPGCATLELKGEELHVHARFEDDSIVANSTGNNQRLWQLGDVMEFFFQAPGQEPYFEFHVAPNGNWLQLQFPKPGFFKENPDASLDELFLQEPAFSFEVSTDANGWEVLARIPLEPLWGPKDTWIGGVCRFSVSRYDYTSGVTAPVLSSTANHKTLNYHQVEDWPRFLLA